MGAAGYSMHQPIAPNGNDANRQKNRRVEIFVLAPDASIAGIDEATMQR
jgi:chemotaxis protein MotB